MSETKHSPAPWRVDEDTDEIHSFDSVIGMVYGSGNTHYDRCKANAQLIAAAPELLAQLKEMVRWYWEGYDAIGVRKLLPETKGPSKDAIALIEKASGEKLEDFL